MLILTRRMGQSIQIFDGDELIAELTVTQVGYKENPNTSIPVRIGIQAPKRVKIFRSELTKSEQ